MLNSLLDIIKGDGSNFAGQLQSPDNWYFDNFSEPLIYALIGFAVVFAGIIIIIAVIWFVGFIMRKTDNLAFLTKHKSKSGKPASSGTNDKAVAAANDEEIPDEVKAAIIAAIMAYYQEKEPKCQFTVKRIKRI